MSHDAPAPEPTGDPRLTYAYYPGCSLESTAEDFNRSSLTVAAKLGMTMIEVPNWICCGSTPAHMTDHTLALALPAENLLQATKMNPRPQAVIAPCSACFNRMRVTNYEINEKPVTRAKVAEALDEDYDGSMDCRHMLDVVVNDVGYEEIARRMTRTLHGLKVASYYGCLITRPHYIKSFDDVEHPTSMDKLVEVMGGTPVQYPLKTDCCGASFAISHPEIVWKLTGNILKSIKKAGAEAIMVACPLCQSNLDLRQPIISKKLSMELNMPVFYFTQLLGFCLGAEEKEIATKKLFVDSGDVMASLEAKSAGEVK